MLNAGKVLVVAMAILAVFTLNLGAVQAQGMGGPGGYWGPGPAQSGGAVTISQAVSLARQTLARIGNPDLVPVEVMEFSVNFYVIVAERSTGRGAFELIVDRYGFVYPEPGPNVMWNTKYGHMAGGGGYGMMGGGMMGGWGGPGYASGGPIPATPQLTRDRARQILQTWLNRAFPGAKAEEGTAFYGYFTFDFEQKGRVAGMASVNAYTGQVWYHTWHGTFVQERELK